MISRTKSTFITFSILIIGFFLGIIATANWELLFHKDDGVMSQAYAEPEQSPVFSNKDIFVEIAHETMPTVVTIYSEKVIQVRRPRGMFPEDEMFRRFFGLPLPDQESSIEEFKQEGLGSGVIISHDGQILTNNHVIEGADEIKVKVEDKTYMAELIGADRKTDIALLKIEADEELTPAILGNSDKVRVGEWVMAIGHPFNLDHTVTVGVISAKGRNRMGITDYEDFLQTDAAINPGNSGGALVNLNGELIGINTAIASATGTYNGIGFAIPVNMARDIMEQLIDHGHVIRGWLGVSIQDIDEDLAVAFDLEDDRGVIVTRVLEDTPAEEAGLEQGDVILAIDNTPVENVSELRNRIASTRPDTKVEFEIIRDNKKKKFDIILGELPGTEDKIVESEPEHDINLGIEVANIDNGEAEIYGYSSGVIVESVEPRSPGDLAGLMPGDLILEINRSEISDIADYNRAISKAKQDRPIIMLVGRQGGLRYIAIKPNNK